MRPGPGVLGRGHRPKGSNGGRGGVGLDPDPRGVISSVVMNDTTDTLPSGRFVLRIDPRLHAALRAAAEEANLSLNEYCARKLASPGGRVAGPAADAVQRAVAVAGEALLGVVAFGSWARDELSSGSDVDLLVVVAEALPITRGLYRSWDESPLSWEGHPVEPHFVHLLGEEDRASGLWAEAALDGVVLHERGLAVSTRLVEVRHRIANGRIERRRSHGHPYWVEVA